MIKLYDKYFLGSGGERDCYIHPNDSTKIIKVLKIRGKHNEQNILEYNYMKYLEKRKVDFSHITRCYGWVFTNKGKGLIFDRIENYDQSPIKTLSYYSKYNIFEKYLYESLTEELKLYLEKNNILFVDASLSNVFCQKVEKNKYKLVIFDGLGGRRRGVKSWLYTKSLTFTKYKIKKQWKKFMKNCIYELGLNLKRVDNDDY